MSLVNRWQYPWIALTILLVGLAIAGYYVSGFGFISIFPALVSLGTTLIIFRPKKFGYIMFGFGVVSIIVAGLYEGGTVARGAVALVGIVALVSGIQSHRNRNTQ